MFVNEALCSMLGFTSAQLLGMSPVDLFHNDYKQYFREMLEQIERGVFNQYMQAVCMTGDEREIWIEERHSVIAWEGNPALILTMRNITDHKLYEIEVQRQKEQFERENIALRSTLKDRYKFGDIIGKSPAMQHTYELIMNAAASNANVVIYGESGAGKELIARTIHQLSERKEQAFVPVNCGAIPDTLFESEVFGHRKGAFTGAHRDKHGFFDIAHRGTLFLDEVGELSPALQVKLLRALEGSGYTPVGGSALRKPDVRIIAATNKNLEKLRRERLIREDFFYRIHVITVTVPPLRTRKEDIPLLVDHFLEDFGKGQKRADLPGKLLEALYTYDWPGNVRELQNVLLRYLAGQPLEFGDIRQTTPGDEADLSGAAMTQETRTLREAVEDFEKRFLVKMLEQNHWRKTETATMLGIDRKTLFRKMKRFGVF